MIQFIRRFFSPIPLATLAVAGATLWLTGVWWIIPLGVLAAGIMAAQGPASEKDMDAEEYASYALGPLPMDLKEKFRSILDEKEKILKELQGTEESVFLNAEELSSRVNELVDTYYHLVLKLEKIRPFIDDAAMTTLDKSIRGLEKQIEACSDEITRENLSLALKSKIEHRNCIDGLSKYQSRVESQLFNVVATMKSLYIRILQLKVSPDVSQDPTSEIKDSLNEMLTDVEVSEKVAKDFQRVLNENPF